MYTQSLLFIRVSRTTAMRAIHSCQISQQQETVDSFVPAASTADSQWHEYHCDMYLVVIENCKCNAIISIGDIHLYLKSSKFDGQEGVCLNEVGDSFKTVYHRGGYFHGDQSCVGGGGFSWLVVFVID